MTARVLILALAAGFLVAPHLDALTSAGCGPCCCIRAAADPCDANGPPCESFESASCCGAAPDAPATPPRGTGEAPTPTAANAAILPIGPATPCAASRFARAAADAELPSPLRLSVVLRI